MASTNILSVFVRGVVVDVQRRTDGYLFVAARQEKKQKTAWLRLKKFLADMLYILADRVHPRQYPSPGLNITQTLDTWPSSDCPIRHKILVEHYPVFTANGDAHYDLSPPVLKIVQLAEEQ